LVSILLLSPVSNLISSIALSDPTSLSSI
jgi:hypothetical protein